MSGVWVTGKRRASLCFVVYVSLAVAVTCKVPEMHFWSGLKLSFLSLELYTVQKIPITWTLPFCFSKAGTRDDKILSQGLYEERIKWMMLEFLEWSGHSTVLVANFFHLRNFPWPSGIITTQSGYRSKSLQPRYMASGSYIFYEPFLKSVLYEKHL